MYPRNGSYVNKIFTCLFARWKDCSGYTKFEAVWMSLGFIYSARTISILYLHLLLSLSSPISFYRRSLVYLYSPPVPFAGGESSALRCTLATCADLLRLSRNHPRCGLLSFAPHFPLSVFFLFYSSARQPAFRLSTTGFIQFARPRSAVSSIL